MRSTEKNNTIPNSAKLLLMCLLIINCFFSVACQTKDQKVAAALKKCQDLLDKDELLNIGNCYFEAEKANPDRIAEISQAAETAVLKKCNTLWKAKNYEKSIVCYEGMTVLKPDSSNVNFLLADSYYQYYEERKVATGEPDFDYLLKAGKSVARGLELSPKDATAHTLYGNILQDLGRFQAAADEYQKTFELNPDIHFMLINIGSMKEKLGENDEAIKNYKKVLELNSDELTTKIALGYLSRLYERIGRIDEAIEILKKLNSLDPNYDDSGEKLKNLKKLKESKKSKPANNIL